MFNEVPIARILRLTLAGGVASAALASLPAQAQMTTTTTQPGQPGSEGVVQRGERVEVTGSNIRRVQSETASPVEVVTREDIARSGKTSVAELLQTLAIDNAGSVPKTFGNGFASSGAGISLRGLGVGATLVLINGRRVAPFPLADDGTKQFTDLNVIPLEAVERLEILKDGGSAVYGSDAIAGVVNIILRKEFSGLSARASVGQSLKYGDGRDTQGALTFGAGSLDTDGYNVFGNIEYHKTDSVNNSNRTDRGKVGKGDLRTDGFTPVEGLGGTGYIVPGGSAASSAINGNVRDPFAGVYNGAAFVANTVYFNRGNTAAGTGFTRSFPAAACSNFTSTPQGDPGGGCLLDTAQKYGQVQPTSEDYNFYGRATFKINDNIEVYAEGNYYNDRTRSVGTPSGVSGTLTSPTGVVTVNGVLGAAHPDNPYFGTATRLRYLTADVGPRDDNADAHFERFVLGSRGTILGWDFDTAGLYSGYKLTEARTGFLQADVLTALLNPTAANVAAASRTSAAYRALPAGTYYRIAENAGLNSPAVYAALSPTINAYGKSETALGDFKISRELFALPGGPLGFAIGTEIRHEQNSLTPTQGTERANIIGLGYSAYSLSRNIAAAYVESIAPVFKWLELNAAARYDHYTDAGNAFNPKGGIKITPIEWLAIRGSYSRGFRAPNAPETGGGTAGFSTSSDPVRCQLNVPGTCSQGSIALISAGSTTLAPERSKTYTGGFVLDPSRNTSLAVDYFKIVRKNEIIAGSGTNESNVLAGRVIRDPTNVSGIAGDPGALIAILTPYQNSSSTQVRGLDLDGRQQIPLGAAFGKLSLGLKWTHFFSYQVTDNTGTTVEYAGTHGNCNVTNCIGTPADRVNADLTYTYGDVTVSAIGNFRASIQNRETKDAPDCETTKAVDGSDNPGNCRIGSFTTVDLTARWQATKNWGVYGSIQNLFDRVPPYDPTTYGATNYNPLDFSGAIGRFFSVGATYKF